MEIEAEGRAVAEWAALAGSTGAVAHLVPRDQMHSFPGRSSQGRIFSYCGRFAWGHAAWLAPGDRRHCDRCTTLHEKHR